MTRFRKLAAAVLTLAIVGCEKAPEIVSADGAAPRLTESVSITSNPSTYSIPNGYVDLDATLTGGSGSYYYRWRAEIMCNDVSYSTTVFAQGTDATQVQHRWPNNNSYNRIQYSVEVRSGSSSGPIVATAWKDVLLNPNYSATCPL